MSQTPCYHSLTLQLRETTNWKWVYNEHGDKVYGWKYRPPKGRTWMARSHCQGNIFDFTLQVMFVLRPKGNKELNHSHTRYEGGFQAKVLRASAVRSVWGSAWRRWGGWSIMNKGKRVGVEISVYQAQTGSLVGQGRDGNHWWGLSRAGISALWGLSGEGREE